MSNVDKHNLEMQCNSMFARSLLGRVVAGHTLITAGNVSCSYSYQPMTDIIPNGVRITKLYLEYMSLNLSQNISADLKTGKLINMTAVMTLDKGELLALTHNFSMFFSSSGQFSVSIFNTPKTVTG